MSNDKKLWEGKKNKAVRMYFYSQRGLALLNEFRYLVMIIFGVYLAAKMTNPVWLAVMFFACLPVLIIVGWMQVHHMAPVINWLDVTHGSYWSKKSMEWQERQVKATETIRDIISSPIEIFPEGSAEYNALKRPSAPIAGCTLGSTPAHEASERDILKQGDMV